MSSENLKLFDGDFQVSNPKSWLELDGEAWQRAVEEATSQLLRDYRWYWPDLFPVDLDRLAASLGAKIKVVRGLSGGARLLPAHQGFSVLISEAVWHGEYEINYRTAVAHELAHTLFYSRDSDDIPLRLFKLPNEREETFCFDVARRLLALR